MLLVHKPVIIKEIYITINFPLDESGKQAELPIINNNFVWFLLQILDSQDIMRKIDTIIWNDEWKCKLM